ncbi:MAG: hypothetical protein ACRC30_15315, partial [Clostridium sp.]
FKLKLSSSSYVETLSGTYSKPGSSSLIGISLQSFTDTGSYPFYCGTVNGAPVTLIQTVNGGNYYEVYGGDNNVFTLSLSPTQEQGSMGLIYDESFNGKKTGVYTIFLDNTGNPGSGTYTSTSNPNVKYPVTFTGSYSPN